MRALPTLFVAIAVLFALLPSDATAGYRHVCTYPAAVCFDQQAYGDDGCEEYHIREDRVRIDLVLLGLAVRGHSECYPDRAEEEGITVHAGSELGHHASIQWVRHGHDCDMNVELAGPHLPWTTTRQACVAGSPPDPGWGRIVP